MAQTKAPQSDEAAVQECLRMLRLPQDEYKLSGLLLIAKYVSRTSSERLHQGKEDREAGERDGNEAITLLRRQVLEALGVPFLRRLLVTTDSYGSRSKYEEKGEEDGETASNERVSMFQSLAVNLLSSFAQDPQLCRRHFLDREIVLQLLGLTQGACHALKERFSDGRAVVEGEEEPATRKKSREEEEELQGWLSFLLDSMEFLEALSAVEGGIELLRAEGSVWVNLAENLVTTMSTVTALQRRMETNTENLGGASTVSDTLQEIRLRTVTLLNALELNYQGGGAGGERRDDSLGALDLREVLLHLLNVFAADSSILRLHLPALLLSLLHRLHGEVPELAPFLGSGGAASLRCGLFQSLQIRLPAEQRKALLMLARMGFICLGSAWVVARDGVDTETIANGDAEPGQLIGLLAKLSAIEVKIALDDLAFHLFERREESADRYKSEIEFQQKLSQEVELVSLSLELLEQIIGVFTSILESLEASESSGEADSWAAVPAETVLQVRESLVGVGDVIVEYYEILAAQGSEAQSAMFENLRRPLPGTIEELIGSSIIASARFMGSLLAEDSEYMDRRGNKVFEFLLQVPDIHFPLNSSSEEDERENLQVFSVIPFLLPAFLQWSFDEHSIRSLSEVGAVEKVTLFLQRELQQLSGEGRAEEEKDSDGSSEERVQLLISAAAVLLNVLKEGGELLILSPWSDDRELSPLRSPPALLLALPVFLIAVDSLGRKLRAKIGGRSPLVPSAAAAEELWGQLIVVVLLIIDGVEDGLWLAKIQPELLPASRGLLEETELRRLFLHFFDYCRTAKLRGAEMDRLAALAAETGLRSSAKLSFMAELVGEFIG